MDLNIQNKVAVVLAGSKGLGRASAEALAAEGCNVAICSRNGKEIIEVANSLENNFHVKTLGLICDVSDAQSLNYFFKEVYSYFSRVDILVNNAGGPPAGNFSDFIDEQWMNACNLSLMSVIRSCRHVIPSMKKQKWGRILNITSISIKQPLPGMILSNTFRAGVAGLSKSLSMELASDNILVHCVMPGGLLTDRNYQLGSNIAKQRNISYDDLVKEWAESVPLKRMGEPKEFGSMVAFLASDTCSFTTGTCIAVDGGTIKSIF